MFNRQCLLTMSRSVRAHKLITSAVFRFTVAWIHKMRRFNCRTLAGDHFSASFPPGAKVTEVVKKGALLNGVCMFSERPALWDIVGADGNVIIRFSDDASIQHQVISWPAEITVIRGSIDSTLFSTSAKFLSKVWMLDKRAALREYYTSVTSGESISWVRMQGDFQLLQSAWEIIGITCQIVLKCVLINLDAEA